MADKTAKLAIVIAGENKGAITAMDQTGTAAGGLESKMGKLGAGITSALSFGALLGAGKAALSGYAEAAGNVAKNARLTGESAKDASLLTFAAHAAGVEATKASAGFVLLAKAAKNGKLEKAGVVTKDESGNLLSFQAILGNLADRYKSLPPGIERTTLATTAFGRAGADVGKILAGGRDGIEANRKEMEKYGLEFNEAGLAKYQKFIKSQREVTASIAGLEVQVTSKVLPAITSLSEKFAGLPVPAKAAIGGVLALTTGAIGLSSAVGLVGPVISRGAAMLGLHGAASTKAAVSTEALAAAEAEMVASEAAATAATAAETAATIAFNDAMLIGLPIETASAAASDARTASMAASTAATKANAEATVTTTGATSRMGAAIGAIGFVGAVAGAAAYANSLNVLKFNMDGLNKATDDQAFALVEATRGVAAFAHVDLTDKFAAAGRKDLPALERASAIYKERTGTVLPELAAAISRVKGEQKQAAETANQYAGSTDSAAEADKKLADRMKETAAAAKLRTDALTAGISAVVTEHDDREALTTATDAYAKAVADEATAHRAAAGDSDEYRQAQQGIADAQKNVQAAQKAEVDANDTLRTSEQDLTKARKDATQSIKDKASAERDANNALLNAQDKIAQLARDPKATASDRRNANNDLLDAQDKATQATRDSRDAAAKGVEGSDQVVAAKKKVADANHGVTDAEDKYRQAVGKVSDATKAAATVLVTAKANEATAHKATADAATAEADATSKLTGDLYGQIPAIQAKIDKLRELNTESGLALVLQQALAGPNPTNTAGAPINSGNWWQSGALAATKQPAPSITINQHLNGTPAQQAAASGRSASDAINHIFRGTFGG